MIDRLLNSQAIKREKSYALLCETYARENIDSEDKVEHCRKAMMKQGKITVAFIVCIAGCLALLLPSIAWMVAITGLMLVLMIGKSVILSRGMATRYIDEVLNAPAEEQADIASVQKDEDNKSS